MKSIKSINELKPGEVGTWRTVEMNDTEAAVLHQMIQDSIKPAEGSVLCAISIDATVSIFVTQRPAPDLGDPKTRKGRRPRRSRCVTASTPTRRRSPPMDEPNYKHAHWFPYMTNVVRIDDPAIVQALAVRKACHEAGLLDENGNLAMKKTADGVVVGLKPSRIYWPCDGKVYEGVAGLEVRVICLDADDSSIELEPHCGITGVYSTREAAERAAKGANDGR